MGARHLTDEQRRNARQLRRKGLTLEEVGRRVGCSLVAVWKLTQGGDIAAEATRDWSAGPGRLSLAEREEISVALAAGETFTAIAARLGRVTSTVSREVAANGGRDGYRAWRAHDAAFERTRRPKVAKLDDSVLAAVVVGWLELLWSPVQIVRRLRAEYPHDPMMWVSHETIYQSLYVQGRGELRRELARCLRSGRAARRPQGSVWRGGPIAGKVMISERPAEVADRAVPGHWEGDLIIGKNGDSQVGTLVERTTRYVLLLQLDDGRAETVNEAMKKAIATLPAELVKTITWDQGSEMAHHAQFSIDTGVEVYFCDPHSPWQRGSNENTNGLLRDFMPKGYDLSALSQDNLDHFAWMLNGRPRETLGYMKPSEKLAELLALTG
jgi:IS30 family transposase